MTPLCGIPERTRSCSRAPMRPKMRRAEVVRLSTGSRTLNRSPHFPRDPPEDILDDILGRLAFEETNLHLIRLPVTPRSLTARVGPRRSHASTIVRTPLPDLL